ncbi:HNH/endonuclease VII fold putative polymorphic toxin [Pseudomonas fluorescens]|uniref:HNH/Endo VII superfamily nuclease toxins domain-containing protein n=1 Tax=Pseudomonas fluorescens TaxID=294 RepID=A0A7Z3C4G1_PSEFL|nr:HNH/endonuclease VII fold putative polymorphic toxin [Pseudomonas fluorescens]QJP95028.1 hypothetical protein C6Y56_10575 [Pseudomonas fluorescens]
MTTTAYTPAKNLTNNAPPKKHNPNKLKRIQNKGSRFITIEKNKSIPFPLRLIFTPHDFHNISKPTGKIKIFLKTKGKTKGDKTKELKGTDLFFAKENKSVPFSVPFSLMTDKSGESILNSDGKPVLTREYQFTRADGSKVVIQDHSAGHQYNEPGNKGDQTAHFNLRPIENTRTGKVPGARDHYYFKEKK